MTIAAEPHSISVDQGWPASYQVWRWKAMHSAWVKFGHPLALISEAQLAVAEVKQRYYDCCTAIEWLYPRTGKKNSACGHSANLQLKEGWLRRGDGLDSDQGSHRIGNSDGCAMDTQETRGVKESSMNAKEQQLLWQVTIAKITPKGFRLHDLVRQGKSWQEAEAVVDREFTEDGMDLRQQFCAPEYASVARG